VNEPCGNVCENKGSAFRSPRRSGNVIENKGSYASKAGMLLKSKVVSRLGRTGFRIQESGFRSQNSEVRSQE
jgi:hypothetical protein